MPIEFKAAGSTDATLSIYDNIGENFWGDGVTSRAFAKELREYSSAKRLTICINSHGGDVDEGIAIYNLLKDHPAHKTVKVDGTAASIASVIAMSGDVIRMGRGTRMMIHYAWTLAAGNHVHFRALADRLERVSGQMAKIYALRTGRKVADILRMMESETEMTEREAVAEKFADETSTDSVRLAAFSGPARPEFGKVPLSRLVHRAQGAGPKLAALKARIAASSR